MPQILYKAFLSTIQESFFFLNMINLIVVQFTIFLGYSLKNQIDILIDILFICIIVCLEAALALILTLFITKTIKLWMNI